MKRLINHACLAAITASCFAAGANAAPDEFSLKLPGINHFNGGILFVTFIGPDVGENIVNTVYDITWHNTGDSNPVDMRIELGVPVDGDIVWYTVTGADLGFSADAKRQRGTFSTAAYNGEVWPNFLGQSIVFAEIWDEQVGNLTGYFVNSTVTFEFGTATCDGDFNGDGVVDIFDLFDFIHAFIAGDPAADVNGDGVIDYWDVIAVIDAVILGC